MARPDQLRNINNKMKLNINRLCIYLFCLISFSSFVFLNPFIILASENYSPFDVDELIGRKAPNFTLPDINGEHVSLSSFKGKVIVLSFWADWCPTCKREFTSLNRLCSTYGENGIVVLSVAIGNRAGTRDFIRNSEFNFRMLIDNDLRVSSPLYKVFMLPTAFIIDKKGIIVKSYFGQQNWMNEKIIKELKDLLK